MAKASQTLPKKKSISNAQTGIKLIYFWF